MVARRAQMMAVGQREFRTGLGRRRCVPIVGLVQRQLQRRTLISFVFAPARSAAASTCRMLFGRGIGTQCAANGNDVWWNSRALPTY